jgi:pimeloyl-ACP methyl ester carboxylesterase
VLAYLERGDPEAPAIIEHHGTPGSRLQHHPDPSVYEGIRAVSFDRPGYGFSDPQPQRTVASVAEDVAALADAFSVERFAVLGGSGGGPHALACAALLPERVTRAAVFVGLAPHDDPDFDFFAGLTETNVREFKAARESEEALAANVVPKVEAIARDPDALMERLAPELPEPDRALLAREDIRAIRRDGLREAVRQGARGWIDDDLAFFARPWGFALERAQCEVRLWQGELDVLVPRSHGEYLARRLPKARLDLIPNAGHTLLDHYRTAYEWLKGASE